MASECLNVGSRERHEATSFEEIEDRQAQQGSDDANVAPPVEAVAELNAAVSVVLIGLAKCLEDTQLDTAGVSVLQSSIVSQAGSMSLRLESIPLVQPE